MRLFESFDRFSGGSFAMAASGMPAFEEPASESEAERVFGRVLLRHPSADSAQQACHHEATSPAPLTERAEGSTRLTDEAPVNVEINNLLKNASKRAERAIKEARQSERKRERATKKARDQAEALLSTEVLLGIAKGRSDVGTIMCQHCAHSISLASALPEVPPPLAKRRRGIRDGRLLIAPAPHGSAPAGQRGREASAQLAAIEDGQVLATGAASARAAPKQLHVAQALQEATGATLSDDEFECDSAEAKVKSIARHEAALVALNSPSSHDSNFWDD